MAPKNEKRDLSAEALKAITMFGITIALLPLSSRVFASRACFEPWQYISFILFHLVLFLVAGFCLFQAAESHYSLDARTADAAGLSALLAMLVFTLLSVRWCWDDGFLWLFWFFSAGTVGYLAEFQFSFSEWLIGLLAAH